MPERAGPVFLSHRILYFGVTASYVALSPRNVLPAPCLPRLYFGSSREVCRWDRKHRAAGLSTTTWCLCHAHAWPCLLPGARNAQKSVHCNYRVTECSGFAGTSVGHLVQLPCRSRVTYSKLQRTLSMRALNISREGDSTTSLGSLFQCSVTLKVESSSSCSAGTSCASVCARCPLSCRWAPLKRAWPHPPDTHP